MRTALLTIALLTAPAAAGVVLDMPAPAPSPPEETPTTYAEWSGEDDTTPTVGDVALHRYSRARTPSAPTGPVLTGADFYATYGGYRVGLSPYTYYGRQDWRGAYVHPVNVFGY